MILVFAAMYARDRARAGYRAVRLERAGASALLALALGMPLELEPQARLTTRPERLRVLFLGDNGHNQPAVCAKELLLALSRNGIGLFYTDERSDLNPNERGRYHLLMLYNNHTTVSESQLNTLLDFVARGRGLVVLNCPSARSRIRNKRTRQRCAARSRMLLSPPALTFPPARLRRSPPSDGIHFTSIR